MMSKQIKTTPASALFAQWCEDPEYQAAYQALEEEFFLATAMISARAQAGLTQEELAERMGTAQSTIARLEGGKGKPSTATLEKLAKATGTKLRISFEPDVRPG